MYAYSYPRSRARVILLCIVCVAFSSVATAQDSPDPPAHEHEAATHDMASMSQEGSIPMTRMASGTAWLPDETPMYMVHRQARGWMLMAHGNAFLQYLNESGDRGSDQVGSINWLMGTAQRPVGAGRLMFRGMASLEPWTIGGCGYPDLLATGELCDGEAIHDRQHPHDLFMEIAAQYDRPLGRGIRLQLYGGPVGEPALGPAAFMHRLSALPNALAPITHHWFDSTHITYGVATAGVYGTTWKAEASLFNGREPDGDRTDFDLAAMDSWSARLWYLPNVHWALQVSGGRLHEAEEGHDDEPRVDVDRLTASATYHRATLEDTIWANTIGWGRNVEGDADGTNALLFESSVTLRDRHAVYGRFEWSEKSAHDLVVPGHEVFTVAKLQGGYTRYFGAWKGLVTGIGAASSVGIVPASLEPTYGRRFNGGFSVYLTMRSPRM